MKRYMALAAELTALGAGDAALGHNAAAGGVAAQAQAGLSMLPAVVEHNAQPGQLTTLTVDNRSASSLGPYTATLRLKQGGKTALSATKKLKVR